MSAVIAAAFVDSAPWTPPPPSGPTIVTLTVPAGKVSTDLADFPMKIDLATLPWGFWQDVTADGGNIRVSKGGVELPVDVGFIDTYYSSGEVFVRTALAAASDNVFTVQAVAGGTMRAATDPLGSNAVWTGAAAGYEAVANFRGPHTTAAPFIFTDRTGHGHDFTVGGGTVAGGLLGVSSSGITVTDDGWAMANVPHLAAYTMGADAIQSARSGHNALLSYNNSDTTTARHTLCTEDSTNWASWNGSWFRTGVLSDIGVRHLVALRSSSANGRQIFRDGVQLGTTATTGTVPSAGAKFLVGSSQTNNTEDWNGSIGLAYLRSGIATPAWLAAEAASWINPSTFYTVPPENIDVDASRYATATATVPAGKVTSDLTNFVVRIKLSDMPSAWWTHVATNGTNLRFRIPGETTYRPLDVVAVNPVTRTGDAYVRVNLSASAPTALALDVTTKGVLSPASGLRRELVWQDYLAVVMARYEPTVNRVDRNLSVNKVGPWPAFVKSTEVVDPDNVHQGLAVNQANGERILINTNLFVRYDQDWVELGRNTNPQGQAKAGGARSAITHMSDGCIVGNELFVGMDDYSGTTFSVVSVFDATTLAFKRSYDVTAINGGALWQISSLCWTGTEFLSVNFNSIGANPNGVSIERYDTSFVHLGTITTSTSLLYKQGVTVMGGKIYISCDDDDCIYRCEMDGSAVTKVIDQDYENLVNAEGLDHYGSDLLANLDSSVGRIVQYSPISDAKGLAFGLPGGYLQTSATGATTFTMGGTGIAFSGSGGNQGLLTYGTPAGSRETLGLDGTTGVGTWNSSDAWLSQNTPVARMGSVRLHTTRNNTVERKLYRDGVLVATDVGAVAPNYSSFTIGTGNTTSPWWGYTDRAYLRAGVLSADWLAAEVASWETPSSFYTVT